jgi:tetratricopeptide (TPR) repeat protein
VSEGEWAIVSLAPLGASAYYTQIQLLHILRKSPIQIDALLEEAQKLASSGQIAAAEKQFRAVLEEDATNQEALRSLVVICLHSARIEDAEQLLRSLVELYPDDALYCDRLASLLAGAGRGDEALACYQHLLAEHPEMIDSRYNHARLLKRLGRLDGALAEYRECLRLNIANPEEVHSNISVILTEQHRHDAAEAELELALVQNPNHVPALYNLALLRQEQGDWTRARALLQDILERQPGHPGALVQLANGDRLSDPIDPIARQIKRVLLRGELSDLEHENLLYAQGKLHDDGGRYEAAFEAYMRANAASHGRVGGYDRQQTAGQIDSLISGVTSDWLAGIEPVSEAAPIFICGMFRSGSTLLEQFLAVHPALTAGGEIDYFQQYSPLPLDAEGLQVLGTGYLDLLASSFPAGTRVTNKRPDNFLYLGLIRALFPNAQVLNTLRHPLDNCLSVYFQPLDQRLSYANNLLDTGHYYREYRRLMGNWQQLMPSSIHDVSYESLVNSPREAIGEVLEFLGLEWHEDCLKFYESANRVRTASVTQVRQPLYTGSIGRWQNYRKYFDTLRREFEQAGIAV